MGTVGSLMTTMIDYGSSIEIHCDQISDKTAALRIASVVDTLTQARRRRDGGASKKARMRPFCGRDRKSVV